MSVASTTTFDYSDAFSRNLGWLTEGEQQVLRGKRIAIAGMGGAGGIHLLTLARLGIANFNIADPDNFEMANFNRQVGAFISTLNQPKTETLGALACDINPEIKINAFHQGVQEDMIKDFLEGVDLYVDGLDFYVLDIRRKIFKYCHEHNIPAITAAPLGMGVAYLIFLPGQITLEQYFGFTDDAESNQLKFLIGLNPSPRHCSYLMDRSTFNIMEKRAPSTIMGCMCVGGVVAAESVKILLRRGKILAAPWSQSFDPYVNRYKRVYMIGFQRILLQTLGVKWLKWILSKRGQKCQSLL